MSDTVAKKVLVLSALYASESFPLALPRLVLSLLERTHPVFYLGPAKLSVPEGASFTSELLETPAKNSERFWSALYLWCIAPFVMLRAAFSFRPRVIVVFHPHDAFVAKPAAVLCGARVVLFCDHAPWKVDRRAERIAPVRGVLSFLDLCGLLAASSIVASSATLANEIISQSSFLKARVHVLPYAPVLPFHIPYYEAAGSSAYLAAERHWLEEQPKRKQRYLRSQHLHDKTFIVAAVDEFQLVERLEYLLRAVSGFEDERVLLLIYGDGPKRLSILSLTISLGLSEQVQFINNAKDFAELLGCVDIAVLPAGYRRYPSILFTLLGVGTPIVGADAPEMRELLSYEELLFEPQNVEAMVHILKKARTNKEYLSRLRALTLERCRRFAADWEGHATELLLR